MAAARNLHRNLYGRHATPLIYAGTECERNKGLSTALTRAHCYVNTSSNHSRSSIRLSRVSIMPGYAFAPRNSQQALFSVQEKHLREPVGPSDIEQLAAVAILGQPSFKKARLSSPPQARRRIVLDVMEVRLCSYCFTWNPLYVLLHLYRVSCAVKSQAVTYQHCA